LAVLLGEIGKHLEAEDDYRKAREVLEKLVADFPVTIHYRHLLGMVLNNSAHYPMERSQLGEAQQMLERAIEHQMTALRSNSRHPDYRTALGNHYRSLTGVLVRSGQHAEAIKSAANAPRLDPESWQEYLRAAEVAAQCVPLAEKDARLPEDRRRDLARAYADQAMAWLRQAVARGLNDPEQLTQQSAFGPLRSGADFLKLVQELRDKRPESGSKKQDTPKAP
jgi:tetratricopeptide (TPR) repeat protein